MTPSPAPALLLKGLPMNDLREALALTLWAEFPPSMPIDGDKQAEAAREAYLAAADAVLALLRERGALVEWRTDFENAPLDPETPFLGHWRKGADRAPWVRMSVLRRDRYDPFAVSMPGLVVSITDFDAWAPLTALISESPHDD